MKVLFGRFWFWTFLFPLLSPPLPPSSPSLSPFPLLSPFFPPSGGGGRCRGFERSAFAIRAIWAVLFLYISLDKCAIPIRTSIARGSLGTDPPGPHPRIRLALPLSGVDSASLRHRFDIDFLIWPHFDAKSIPEEGRIRGGPVPNRPLTKTLKTSTKSFCNTIATTIERYEKQTKYTKNILNLRESPK